MPDLVSSLKVEIDTSAIQESLIAFKKEIADAIRRLPFVTEPDGSQWADVGDLRALADHLEGL